MENKNVEKEKKVKIEQFRVGCKNCKSVCEEVLYGSECVYVRCEQCGCFKIGSDGNWEPIESLPERTVSFEPETSSQPETSASEKPEPQPFEPEKPDSGLVSTVLIAIAWLAVIGACLWPLKKFRKKEKIMPTENPGEYPRLHE